MIIYGLQGVTYTKNKGEFECPSCGDGSSYKHKRVRRFFSLYFIPIIPLNMVGEYVECKGCKGTYRLEALDASTSGEREQFVSEFQRASLRVMVEMMLIDGVIDDSEIAMIQELGRTVVNAELSEDDIRSEIDAASQDQDGVMKSMESFAGVLNDKGKELVMRAALQVAMADGEFHEDEQAMLEGIGMALGMSPAHIRGVTDQVLHEINASVS